MACLYQKLEVKCILKANCASSLEPCKNLVFSCCHNLAVLATSQSVLNFHKRLVDKGNEIDRYNPTRFCGITRYLHSLRNHTLMLKAAWLKKWVLTCFDFIFRQSILSN